MTQGDVPGALLAATSDAVVVLRGARVVGFNPRAEQLLGVSADVALNGGRTGLEPHLPALTALDPDGAPVRLALSPGSTVEAVRRVVDDCDLLVLRDVSLELRREQGLRRLAGLSQLLLSASPPVSATLQTLVTVAKEMVGADYSVLMLLREGSLTEAAHVVYDAPRELFPSRLPRFVGLLRLPLETRRPVRLDDLRAHPPGVGLPDRHPPLGALLVLPLLAGDTLLGELAVSNAPGGRAFDALDESLLVDLAAHAAVAVRWAQAGEAAEAQAARRAMALEAARHDIRTPLAAGKGYAALLSTRLEQMSPVQVDTALSGLRACFERIEAFTARLLVDERLDAGAAAPYWQPVDVVELLDEVRRDAVAVTGREDAVVVHREPTAPRVLAGDPEQVREVVDNLVGNALKYAGDAGPVEVTVRAEGDQVRLDVRDRGPGIAEDDQDALFERWSRTDAARAALQPGLGLGLSIVRRMVLAHGGLVGVSSRPGEGATFWVTFPARRPAP